MIKPVLQDNTFLEDVSRAKENSEQSHLWWLGQSGYLIQWQGHHLLIDPYLSDSLTKKYAGTNKPHVRTTERVIAPERLDFVDVVTSSHNHTDHLDGETLIPLWKANPNLTVIVSGANVDFAAERLQISPQRLTPISADGDAISIDPFTFHAIPSAHEMMEQDENGDHRFIGLIIQVGKWTIYHSGDCILYGGLVERLKDWKIDIHAGIVIPCHYEMFEFNTVSPKEFVKAANEIEQEYQLLKCGQRLDL